MRHTTHIALLLISALVLACTGSKPMAKRAGKLDAAGMYSEAAEMYLQSLMRNNRNVDAKIGLKKTGQIVLDEKLGAFFRSMATGGNKAASVAAYQEAEMFRDRVQRMGVMLTIPEHYQTDFARVKDEHLLDLYEEGQARLAEQDFMGAEKVFARIAKLEPNYRDASSLQTLAYLEPLYRAGKIDLDAGRYRKAYDEFDRIVKRDAGYKDASALRQEALNKGRYSIAVLPFTSANKRDDVAAKIQAYAMTSLTRTTDPFLRVVDRENMDRILEEQRLGLSGIVDEQTAVRVGNLMGAQAVLIGTLLSYHESPGQLRRSTKNGFESYSVQMTNQETGEKYFETRYKPVKYSEFFQENVARMSFSYRLVSLETGEVLVSKVVDREAKDHMCYAHYEGNRDRLFPASGNNTVELGSRARNDLRGLLGAPRELKSSAVLGNQLLEEATSGLASAVQQELAQRIP